MSTQGPQVTINPGILKWARESMGFNTDLAAKKISVKPEILQNWEQMESSISISKLRKIANAYKRSLGLFLLPTVPAVPLFPPDFRTLDSTKTEDLSPETRLAIRKAERNREFFVEVMNLLEQDKEHLNFSLTLNDSPSEQAKKFRSKLGISLETQFEWGDKNVALKSWIKAIENLGILVFQMSIPIKELRAFCLRENNLPPAIVLNTKDDPNGRIFSLIHELSHLLIKQVDIDLLKRNKTEAESHKIVEWFANDFAGSFLVPNDSLLSNPYTAQYLENKTDHHLQKLKSKYKVSAGVIIRRLYNLKKLTKSEYEAKKKSLDEEIEQYKKRQELKKKDKSGFRDVGMESFQRTGVLLSSKTFTAVEQGKMTGADLARFFEIKQKHIGKIKKLLDSRSG